MVLTTLASVQAAGQASFDSGSTGADGAFAPTQTVYIQIPPSGIFHHTTYTIPSGVTVFYLPNVNNTPVTILTTGNVSILGSINIVGQWGNNILGGRGGPGGFRGGDGGAFDSRTGLPGEGPGGGAGGIGAADFSSSGSGGGGGFLTTGQNGGGVNGGLGGMRYGTRAMIPLIGGSGGGGGSAFNNGNGFGGGGGGGGGAILLASSGNINFSDGGIHGVISANGGSPAGNGGAGSGGAIRVVANTISGNPRFWVGGGQGGAPGYIRVEANDLTSMSPVYDAPFISLATPNPVTLSSTPSLRILSVGGISSPATPRGSFSLQPDIVVPTSTPNPVSVSIEASNIPVGTVLLITLISESGARTTFSSSALAGSQATSTATANVTLPTSGVVVISASVTLNMLIVYDKPVYMDGERVKTMEVVTQFGGDSQTRYITDSGRLVQ